MQPNGIIFWDWNGTLLDDVDFTHGCLNWMLETHGYPQRYDLAEYREIFGFPIEEYYLRAGFDFARHPYPELAADYLIEQVRARGLEDYFTELLGLQDIYGVSKVQVGKDWLRNSGVDPAACVMVGDTTHDAEVAAAMGTKCVLCTSGHQSRARLEAVCAHVIDDISQLPGVLETL